MSQQEEFIGKAKPGLAFALVLGVFLALLLLDVQIFKNSLGTPASLKEALQRLFYIPLLSAIFGALTYIYDLSSGRPLVRLDRDGVYVGPVLPFFGKGDAARWEDIVDISSESAAHFANLHTASGKKIVLRYFALGGKSQTVEAVRHFNERIAQRLDLVN